MKIHIYTLILAAAGVLLLPSCVKDRLYHTPHPDKGVLVVTADFSDRTDGAEIPSEYMVSIEETAYAASTASAFVYPDLLSPEEHGVSAYNLPSGMSVSEGIVSAYRPEDGSVEPMPGYLFTCFRTVGIAADDTVRTDLQMVQRTGDLYFEFEVIEGDVTRVSSVTGTLSGVAGSFDIAAGAIGTDSGNALFGFTVEGDTVSSQVRLLGLIGTQMLTLEMSFTDGRSQSVDVDVTGYLDGFGADLTEPLELRGNLSLPVEAGFYFTVSDLESTKIEEVDLY